MLRFAFAALLIGLSATVVAQNQALTLRNGTNGSLTVPNSPATVAPAQLTVEAWVTFDESTLGTLFLYPTIARGGGGSTTWSWFLRVQADNVRARIIRFAYRSASGLVTLDWNFGPGELLVPTHLAATFDGATMRILKDGVEVATRAGNGPIVNGGGDLAIGEGRRDAFNSEVWNGAIDSLRIWDVALDVATIRGLMFTPLGGATGLLGEWNFEGNLLDSSGNGINALPFGTINYAPLVLPTQFEYQINAATARLDFAGRVGTAFRPALTTVTVAQPTSLALGSTLVGNPFDVLYTIGAGTLPLSAGAITSANGQFLNLNLTQAPLGFLFGGSLVNPFGASFPGPLNLPFSVPAPLTLSAQMLILDPSIPDLFRLSAAGELRAQ